MQQKKRTVVVPKLISWFAISIIVVLFLGSLVPVLLIIFAPGEWDWEQDKNLSYIQHLPSPDNEHIFVLFDDYSGIGDPSRHIFKLENNVDVETLQISREDYRNDVWKDKEITWNYSEGGDHTENPHIFIIDDTYLVFVRGGIYHSLYNIETDEMLIEDHSPWHAYQKFRRNISLLDASSQKDREKSFYEWKMETFHKPIIHIIGE